MRELHRPSNHCLLAKLVPILRIECVARTVQQIPMAVFSATATMLLFLPSSSSTVLTRLSGPCSRPSTSQKSWKREGKALTNSNTLILTTGDTKTFQAAMSSSVVSC
jgi:hypothetical protein